MNCETQSIISECDMWEKKKTDDICEEGEGEGKT